MFLCALLLCFTIFSCTMRTSKDGKEVSFDFDGEKFAQSLEETNLALLKAELGCESVMKNSDLDVVLKEIDDTWFDKNKLDVAKEEIKKSNQCINVYQVTSMIDYVPADDRFEFARFAYGRTIDRENFGKVKAYLEDENEKAKLEAIYEQDVQKIKSRKEHTTGAEQETIITKKEDETVEEETKITACTSPSFSEAKFEELSDYILDGHMPEDRLDRAKQVTKDACLSVVQVKDIMEIINFPDEQVLFAKYAFSRTFDKNNYCSTKNSVIYPRHKSRISAYLKRKGLDCESSQMEELLKNM